MALTQAQLAVLKADIAASEFAALPHTADNAFAIAEAYNLDASPDFWVWRTAVPFSEFYERTSPAPANKVWSWTLYSGMNAGESGAWLEMGGPERRVNMSMANVRAGIDGLFSGPSGADTRAHIAAIGRRLSTRVEKLFATGTGSTASPGTMVFEGLIGYHDVLLAWEA